MSVEYLAEGTYGYLLGSGSLANSDGSFFCPVPDLTGSFRVVAEDVTGKSCAVSFAVGVPALSALGAAVLFVLIAGLGAICLTRLKRGCPGLH